MDEILNENSTDLKQDASEISEPKAKTELKTDADLTEPKTEPDTNAEILSHDISLGELKEYARIIGDDENATLKLCFFGAIGFFESYTQRSIKDFSELPRELKLWLFYKTAGLFEMRQSAGDERVYNAPKGHLDAILDFYRKPALRLGLNELDRLKAQNALQSKLLKDAYTQLLELNAKKNVPDAYAEIIELNTKKQKDELKPSSEPTAEILSEPKDEAKSEIKDETISEPLSENQDADASL